MTCWPLRALCERRAHCCEHKVVCSMRIGPGCGARGALVGLGRQWTCEITHSLYVQLASHEGLP